MELQPIFTVNMNPLEIIIRGSLIYFVLLILLRMFKRLSANFSMTDLLLIVLIADASQNAMAGEYKTVTEGIILVSTLIFWDFLLDALSWKFRKIRRIIHPPTKLLIYNGKMIRQNMRSEFVSEDELVEQLHKNGIEHMEDVKEAFLESNGEFTAIKKIN